MPVRKQEHVDFDRQVLAIKGAFLEAINGLEYSWLAYKKAISDLAYNATMYEVNERIYRKSCENCDKFISLGPTETYQWILCKLWPSGAPNDCEPCKEWKPSWESS